ncbi:MAG: hypothetical protein J1F17_04080, partial [Oscillospiraceae bacterium]|nr:hypothetical protein [Oscillospiraceae bacterium]
MKTVKELFSDYICTESIEDSILNTYVDDLKINTGIRSLSFVLVCDRLYNNSDFQPLNDELMNSKLLFNSVSISPRYNPSLFTPEYFSQLLITLKQKIPALNGTFKDCTV